MWLMDVLEDYLGSVVNIEVSGQLLFTGYLIDLGTDVIVINNGKQYIYLPYQHIHSVKKAVDDVIDVIEEGSDQGESQIKIDNGDSINFRKILCNAKGLFIECYITGNHTLHGYITQIMDDYLVFFSPVYRTTFISFDHLKYIIPYYPGATPYSADKAYLSVNQTDINFAPTFEQLLKSMEGRFMVLDLGGNPDKTGFFKSIRSGIIQLVTANGEVYHWNLKHIKTAHLP